LPKYGLTFSTFLTLVVVPVMFLLTDLSYSERTNRIHGAQRLASSPKQ
jgi:hypothetical protein